MSTVLVDTEPVRTHLRRLADAGLGRRRIAKLAGVCPTTVQRLRNQGDSQVRVSTATALLAVPPPAVPMLVPNHGDVCEPAEPVWRLVRGMQAAGYPAWWISRQLCSLSDTVPFRTTVTVARADRVRALAARCVQQPGPCDKSRKHAARNGWQANWLDGVTPAGDPVDPADVLDIDHVAVDRAVSGGGTVDLSQAERREVVRRLAGTMSASRIAGRVGCSRRQVQRDLAWCREQST